MSCILFGLGGLKIVFLCLAITGSTWNFFILVTANKAAPTWAQNLACPALQINDEFSICPVLLMVTARM